MQVGLPCYLVTYEWVKSVTLPADGSKHSSAALMLAGGAAGVRACVRGYGARSGLCTRTH